MPTIAALLTCHNRKNTTLSCIQHLYECIIPVGYTLEVYLVDDGSTDGTSDAVRNQYPAINVIQGNGSLYWNQGMRIAWREAAKVGYDYYFWLNDDTFLNSDCIENMIAESKLHGDNSLLCGATNSIDSQYQTYGGYLLGSNSMLECNGVWQLCHFFNGNIVFVPSQAYRCIGILDERFWHSFGDFDYGLRARSLGIESFVSPRAFGICDAHRKMPIWKDPEYRFSRRWSHFVSPTGPSLRGLFIFETRHRNIVMAFFHVVSNLFVLMFPNLRRGSSL